MHYFLIQMDSAQQQHISRAERIMLHGVASSTWTTPTQKPSSIPTSKLTNSSTTPSKTTPTSFEVTKSKDSTPLSKVTPHSLLKNVATTSAVTPSMKATTKTNTATNFNTPTTTTVSDKAEP